MLPVAHEPETGSLCHVHELLRCGMERNCGAISYHCWFSSDLPVSHSAQHPEPRPQTVFAVKVGKHFLAAGKLRTRIVNFDKRNFSQEYAGVRFGDSVDFAQACRDLFPRNHQQYAVTDDNRSAFISDRQVVRQSLFDVETKPAQHSDFLLCGKESKCAADAEILRHSKQRAISAANVY